MTTTSRCAAFLLLGLALLTLTGCLPDTVTIGLGSRDQTLRDAAVITEPDAGRNKIAMIELQGMIADAPQATLIGSRPSLIDHLVRRLQVVEKDDDIKAVILRVNSPGGTVTGSDIMYREIRRFREQTGKPVVVSMGEVAASGGYYISLAADEILAEPTTVTGSIGVIMATINVSEGLNRIGIYARAVTSGPNKDMASPLMPPEEAHFSIIQAMVDDYYAGFRGLVVETRDLDDADVDMLTDGRVFTGQAAAALGLVDANGGIREAFECAKALAGVESARLIRFHTGKVGPKTVYAHTDQDAAMVSGELNVLSVDAGSLSPLTEHPVAYYLWAPGITVR